MMRVRGVFKASVLVGVMSSLACRSPQQATVVAPLPVPEARPLPSAPPPPDPRLLARERVALAAELDQMWTRDSDQLVTVLQQASLSSEDSVPLTFLLAIAHAETNGRILDVSEAGAVGLAQATPVAFLMEHFSGPLFVTADYVDGEKAYLLKKPLHDADNIASLVLEGGDQALPRAYQLLSAANELRSVGVDDLDTMAHFAGPDFYPSIDRATARNAAMLAELQRLLDGNDRAALSQFRDRVREEYRSLRQQQRRCWASYQRDLINERDRLLRQRYGTDAATVKKEWAYEAGEYLAQTLDARFSARQMACFLSAHLRTKRSEALRLGATEENLFEMTSALYNGGEHNVRRMQAHLITSLPETENYMRKVPATKHRLDQVIARIEGPKVIASTASATSRAAE